MRIPRALTGLPPDRPRRRPMRSVNRHVAPVIPNQNSTKRRGGELRWTDRGPIPSGMPAAASAAHDRQVAASPIPPRTFTRFAPGLQQLAGDFQPVAGRVSKNPCIAARLSRDFLRNPAAAAFRRLNSGRTRQVNRRPDRAPFRAAVYPSSLCASCSSWATGPWPFRRDPGPARIASRRGNAVRSGPGRISAPWVFRHSFARRSRSRTPSGAASALSPIMDGRRAAIAVSRPRWRRPPPDGDALRRFGRRAVTG